MGLTLSAILIFFLFSNIPVHAGHIYKEKVYQEYWCSKYNGQTEIRLDDKTRVDCITENYAVEFDFANKWAECLGQSLHYSNLTGKRPACVLIIEHGKDWKQYKKLRKTARKHAVKVWYVTPEQIKQSRGI
jgi:hypothetical protein